MRYGPQVPISNTFYMTLSIRFNGHFPGGPGLADQNVSILDFIGAKDDGGGGDNWNYKTCKTNYCHAFYMSIVMKIPVWNVTNECMTLIGLILFSKVQQSYTSDKNQLYVVP